jgi:Flp pilus assembly protein TadG
MEKLARFRGWASGESGQSLVLFTVGLVGFLGLVGMAVDVGRILWTRTELQRTADAAALAGSQLLPGSKEQASYTANTYVTYNGGAACQPNCTTFNEAGDEITVTPTRRVDHYFLKFVGIPSTNVNATATVRVQVVTGLAFGNPAVFPFTIWGGNPSYPGCNKPYGLCDGASKVYRSNQWDNQVSNSVKGPGKAWDIPGNDFKGFFNYGSGSTVYQTNPYEEYSFGGNATSVSSEMRAKLREHYLTGRPIVIPVITTGRCTNNCGEYHFTIVAWVALKLTRDPSENAGYDWTGVIVSSYQVPGGQSGGYLPPTTYPTVSTATLIQ